MRRVAARGDNGEVELAFDLSGADLDAAIAAVGEMPLPPYIAGKRAVEDGDRIDYQTMFAAHDGAVAAPTAGLHFTPELMAALDRRGISRHFVTLHVGAGTFLPVKAEDTRDHKMHFETGEVSRGDCGGTQCRAGARRAHRRRWYDLAPPIGDRGALRRDWGIQRRDRHLHHSRLSVSRCRRADD